MALNIFVHFLRALTTFGQIIFLWSKSIYIILITKSSNRSFYFEIFYYGASELGFELHQIRIIFFFGSALVLKFFIKYILGWEFFIKLALVPVLRTIVFMKNIFLLIIHVCEHI
jgi:hypothetical protein